MNSLLALRSEVMNSESNSTKEQLRDEIIQLIESSRKTQEGYTVPRNTDGEMADTSNTPTMELLNLVSEIGG